MLKYQADPHKCYIEISFCWVILLHYVEHFRSVIFKVTFQSEYLFRKYIARILTRFRTELHLSVSASPVHVKCRTDTVVQGMILCWLCEFGTCFCSCAQSGNGRHSSHQRKINQQEESCQNLTDFTPARVPSKVDIFTAYNDSLQCSHECMRAGIPVYTDEMIQHTPIYKTSYNGNRQASNINIYSAEKKLGWMLLLLNK